MAKKSEAGSYLDKIPSPFRNRYFLTFLIFLVWILFFDKNNLLAQRENNKVSSELKAKKEQYEKDIKIVEQERKAMDDPKELERIAREKYLMKKENEDVYVIVEED